uniref:F-box protein 5 n=1 Tax=Varanus komodoensis TaxID=61221 RepID=A0A8D2LT55_VARKO
MGLTRKKEISADSALCSPALLSRPPLAALCQACRSHMGEEAGLNEPAKPCGTESRDINCSHVHCGLTPLKSTGTEKRSEDPSIANHNEEFCKECTKERLVHSDLQHESPKNVSIKSEGKTIHNKENHRLLWRHMNTIEMDIGNEDSGYSSLLGNQPESSEHDVILAGNINDTPNHSFSQRKNLLPVLHFEELVCSTLKKTSKRNQKTWAHVLDKIASRHSMDFINLIGKKVGLDKLDILSELFHGKFRHLLANILRHLSCMDLINVAKVSTTWKKILQDDKWAFQMYNKALELTLVAKTLKNTESLKICHHCGSPAKYDSHLQRATCIREGCGFDFCTKCLCSYHTAKDCTSAKAVKPSSKLGALPGTKRSKQNLRRL